MNPIRNLVIAGAALGAMIMSGMISSPLRAQNAEWVTMEFANLAEPGPMSWIAREIWPDVTARENAYHRSVLKRPLPDGGASIQILSASREVAGSTYLVSIVLSLDCTTGANHNSASAEASDCPLRIARKDGDRWVILHADRGCFVDPQDAAALPAHRHDGAQVRFDPARRMIGLRANIGGSWIAACSRSIQLP